MLSSCHWMTLRHLRSTRTTNLTNFRHLTLRFRCKAFSGKTYINDEALAAEALKRKGLSSDGLDAADRNYFTQFRNLNSEQSYGRALEEATDTIGELMKLALKTERRFSTVLSVG